MKVYHYDKETGEYISESDANECQIEKGTFFIPANATDIKPPKAKKGCSFYFISGEWMQVSDKANATKIDAARLQRATLLSASDWTQLSDVPNETRTKWAYYRQQLRDITLQPGFPSDIVWPELPK